MAALVRVLTGVGELSKPSSEALSPVTELSMSFSFNVGPPPPTSEQIDDWFTCGGLFASRYGGLSSLCFADDTWCMTVPLNANIRSRNAHNNGGLNSNGNGNGQTNQRRPLGRLVWNKRVGM